MLIGGTKLGDWWYRESLLLIIGILLCQDKNDAVMKMMLLANNEQIFASKYKTVLPTTDELKRILSKVNNDE